METKKPRFSTVAEMLKFNIWCLKSQPKLKKQKKIFLVIVVMSEKKRIFAIWLNNKNIDDMKVKELVEKLNLKVLCGESGLDRDIDGCYVSDLLSDVMGNAEMGNVWVTLQTHKNVMAIASLKELACVILVKGLTASEDTVEQSNEEGIPFLSTDMQTYETVGKIYQLLNQ